MGTAQSISILAILNAITAVLGFAATVLIGHLFGTKREIEIYFAACTLQAVIVNLTQSGKIGELFIPIYLKHKHDVSEEHARRCFAVILNWMIIVVTAMVVIAAITAPALMDLLVPGFANADKELAVSIFRWLAPLAVVNLGLAQLEALANAESWFGRPEACLAAGRIAHLVVIAFFVTNHGVWAIVWGWWAATSITFLGLLIVLYKLGYRHRLALSEPGFSVWSILSRLMSTLSNVIASQVFSIVLTAGLSQQPQGLLAVFQYSKLIYERTMAIVIRPIFVVFLTQISQALAQRDNRAPLLIQLALSRSLAVIAPLVATIAVAGESLLRAIFGGEHFSNLHLRLTAMSLVFFYAILVLMCQHFVAFKTSMAVGLVHRVNWSRMAGQIVSCWFAWVLPLSFGLKGAVLAVGVEALMLAISPLLVLLWCRRELAATYKLVLMLQWTLAGGIGWALGIGLRNSVGVEVEGRFACLLSGVLFALVTVSSTLAVAWAIKIPEARQLASRMRSAVSVVRRLT